MIWSALFGAGAVILVSLCVVAGTMSRSGGGGHSAT
jgi:hypothetical protein